MGRCEGPLLLIKRPAQLRIGDRCCELEVLFDTGSTLTLMPKWVVDEKLRGVEVKALRKPRRAYVLNGTWLTVASYIDGEILVDGASIEERVYVAEEAVREVEVEGAKVRMPELIVGASTMEAWGVELDLKRGRVTVKGAALLI